MMEASNERTLPFAMTESFEMFISYVVYMLLGPPSIDITS
jgi:hypothetical protein